MSRRVKFRRDDKRKEGLGRRENWGWIKKVCRKVKNSIITIGLPWWRSKESTWNAGDLGLIPGLRKFPWRREWPPTPVFWPGEFHGQRILVDYNHGVTKKSDTTERLNTFRS